MTIYISDPDIDCNYIIATYQHLFNYPIDYVYLEPWGEYVIGASIDSVHEEILYRSTTRGIRPKKMRAGNLIAVTTLRKKLPINYKKGL